MRNDVVFRKLSLSSFLGRILHAQLIALLACNGQSHHQGHKLFKVHLAVAVGVQVLHDPVHGSRVLLGLRMQIFNSGAVFPPL